MDLLAVDAPHLKSRCRSSGETSKTKESFFHCQVAFRGGNLIVMCGTLSSKLVTSRVRQYSLVRAPGVRPLSVSEGGSTGNIHTGLSFERSNVFKHHNAFQTPTHT